MLYNQGHLLPYVRKISTSKHSTEGKFCSSSYFGYLVSQKIPREFPRSLQQSPFAVVRSLLSVVLSHVRGRRPFSVSEGTALVVCTWCPFLESKIRERLESRVIIAGCLQNGSRMLPLTWIYLVSCLFCKKRQEERVACVIHFARTQHF